METIDERKEQSIQACYNWIWNTRVHLQEMRRIKEEARKHPSESGKRRRWESALYLLMLKVRGEIRSVDVDVCYNVVSYMHKVMDLIEDES